jgi:outer membrane beta-barrel protein
MKRLVLGLAFFIISNGARAMPAAAEAAQAADAPAGDAPAKPEKAEKSDGTDIAGAVTATTPGTPGDAAKRSWEDVVVVPRKAFLKSGRLELFPQAGVSVNDVLIRHYAFGGQLNYYLSDVFAVGLEGQYFIKERTDRESLVGLQYNRVATLNHYLWSGSINFAYVPAYGKFTLFNKFIINWDLYAQGGVGVIQTEIIPRVVGDATFKNNRIMPNVGAGTHLFLSNWLTFNFAVKDYIFNDLFEPTDRMRGEAIASVQSRAQSQLIQNVMLYAGIGLYLPTSFQYRTPR